MRNKLDVRSICVGPYDLELSCCVVTNAFSHFIVAEINGKTPFMLRAHDKIQNKWKKQMTNSNGYNWEKPFLSKDIFRADLEH